MDDLHQEHAMNGANTNNHMTMNSLSWGSTDCAQAALLGDPRFPKDPRRSDMKSNTRISASTAGSNAQAHRQKEQARRLEGISDRPEATPNS